MGLTLVVMFVMNIVHRERRVTGPRPGYFSIFSPPFRQAAAIPPRQPVILQIDARHIGEIMRVFIPVSEDLPLKGSANIRLVPYRPGLPLFSQLAEEPAAGATEEERSALSPGEAAGDRPAGRPAQPPCRR